LTSWIRDPGWLKNQDQDHISESVETIFWGFKKLKFFVADPDLESGIFLTPDLGYGIEKFGSGINIPDPQH
jgi:hypothetical protein